HYRVDADWTAVTGYSMGGFGTYRLMARWPDLFSRTACCPPRRRRSRARARRRSSPTCAGSAGPTWKRTSSASSPR
ncbi:MAG: hypothetical protein KY433_10055, partial [Actinobacteria bacterium]|nr:hypothetical protein [Actinomycetota bacterium]